MKTLLVLLAVAALAASPALGVQLDRRHLSKSYRVYAGDMASAGGEIQLTVGAKIDFTSAANDIKTACNSFITKLDNFGTNLFDNTVNNAFQLVVTEYNTFKALADNIIAVLPFGDIAAAVSKAANAPVPPVMADFNKMFQVSFGFSVPISNFFNLYKALISLMGAGDTVLNLGWLDRIPAAVSATGPLSKTGAFIETEKFLSSNNYIKRPQPTLLETYDMLLSNKADMAQHMRRMLTDDDINCNATLAATAVLNAAVDVVDMGLQAVDGLAQEWQTGFAVVGSIVKLIVGCCESICATLGHF